MCITAFQMQRLRNNDMYFRIVFVTLLNYIDPEFRAKNVMKKLLHDLISFLHENSFKHMPTLGVGMTLPVELLKK